MDMTEMKRNAAKVALEFIRPGCALGVGTGSTVACLIDKLDVAPKPGLVVSSSKRSQDLLEAKGFKVTDLNQSGGLDVYIDGADEFTDRFTLIKGGGGAHVREKVLVYASSKFVVIADESKKVDVLGKFPVAVEVLKMARSLVARKLVALGASPTWREGFETDEGNVILDCAGFTIQDAASLEREICSMPGVVDCGICALRPADVILYGTASGSVKRLDRE